MFCSPTGDNVGSLQSKGHDVSGIAMSRIMLPDDANPTGNIHGGVTLDLMAQAGYVASSRHCNVNAVAHGDDRPPLTIGLARVSQINFYEPMYVGNVAELQAAITYTSPHSMEVTVDVWAENLKTGRKKCTNTGTLWYVALPSDVEALKRGAVLKPLPVPQLEGLGEEEREEGRRRYEAQKASRESIEASLGLNSVHPLSWFPRDPRNVEEHTVPASQTTLSHIVHPSNCTTTGFLTGGTLMKLMDEAAAICAMRHTKEVSVTACIDAMDFHRPVMNGEVVSATARVVFTSDKTMEIEVCVEAEGLMTKRRVTSTAYFTYISLGEGGRAAAVPPLKLQTEEERERFEEGRRRYEDRKKLRRGK